MPNKNTPPPRYREPKLSNGKGAKPKSAKPSKPASAKKKSPAAGTQKKVRQGKPAAGSLPFWKRRRFWGNVLSLGFTFAIGLLCVLIYFVHDLPDISALHTLEKRPGITVQTRDGLTLASYGDVYGDYIPFEAIPTSLVNAVMATEDRRFYDHIGVDFIGIARAMLANLRAGRFVQGGSTITQQVAKNLFLTPDRTITRKIQEALLAIWLEYRYSKQEILAIYLNRMYLGSGNWGIDAASRRYFDKPATDITLIESAVLAGLLKAPTRFSPAANPEKAKDRAHQVLRNMVDAGLLKADEIAPALESFVPPKSYREGDASGSRYFTDWVMERLPEYVGDLQSDLVVITTLNPDAQRLAEEAVETVLKEEGEEKHVSQAAVISMTPEGAVLAMVGGKSYRESQYNRAVQAERQPGSVFKLFVYLAALEAGITPDMLVEDRPLDIQVGNQIWRPGNFTNRYDGEMTVSQALANSVNTVAVQLSQAVGPDKVADMARRLGLPGIEPRPSIALGAVDANLLQLTGAYAHLANEGDGVLPYGIEEIRTPEGMIIYQRSGNGLWVVLRHSVVMAMNEMLLGVVQNGTGRRAAIGAEIAGKTGTSSDYRDAWFIGFTGNLVTGVWVGNDDNTAMKKVTGGSVPAEIWKRFMQPMLEKVPSAPIAREPREDGDQLPWQSEPSHLDQFLGDQGYDRRDVERKDSFWDGLFEGSKKDQEFPSERRRH